MVARKLKWGKRCLKENSVTGTKRESLRCNGKNYDWGGRRPGFTLGPSVDLLSRVEYVLFVCFVSEKQLPYRKMRKCSEASFVRSGALET